MRAERLVEEQQRGIEKERAHEADPLALPARELPWVALERVGREARQLDELGAARVDPRGWPAEVAGHQLDVLGGREVREEAAVLHDVAHLRRAARTLAAASAAPRKRTTPASGVGNPSANRRMVVLPEPLGR